MKGLIKILDFYEIKSLNKLMVSIRFPSGINPSIKLKFSDSSKLEWEIIGIMMHSIPSNNEALNNLLKRKKDGIWECEIKPLNHDALIKIGEYEII